MKYSAKLCGLAAALILSGCTHAAPTSAGTTQIRFAISGMNCEGCAGGIRSELLRTPGVRSVNISLKTGEATVLVEGGKTDAPTLVKVIAEAGFQASPIAK